MEKKTATTSVNHNRRRVATGCIIDFSPAANAERKETGARDTVPLRVLFSFVCDQPSYPDLLVTFRRGSGDIV